MKNEVRECVKFAFIWTCSILMHYAWETNNYVLVVGLFILSTGYLILVSRDKPFTKPGEKEYKYLVSFSHDKGFGNTVVTLLHLVSDMNDVDEIRDYITNNSEAKHVIILNLTLLD